MSIRTSQAKAKENVIKLYRRGRRVQPPILDPAAEPADTRSSRPHFQQIKKYFKNIFSHN